MDKKKLTLEDIAKIEHVLSKGDRVELIPVRDGVKILHIRREEVRRDKSRQIPFQTGGREGPSGVG